MNPWPPNDYPLTFNVFPRGDRRGLYVGVRLFPNQAAMLDVINAESRVDGTVEVFTDKTQGVVATDLDCQRRQFAIVNLSYEFLDADTISHEFFHAALAWGWRKRFNFNLLQRQQMWEVEEALATVHGTMVTQFINEITELGIYPPKVPS